MLKRSAHLKRTDLVIALILAFCYLIAYALTLTPSLSYRSPDGNELATVPYLLGLAHMPGYPLYTWLGKLFTLLPIGDVAHRMNLMSAVLGALGAGGLYWLVTALLHDAPASPSLRRVCAALVAVSFAFSPTLWSQAVIAEVYAPNILMIALTLILLLRWEHTRKDGDFSIFALAYGLSLGTHLSNLGFAPAFAVFVLITDPTVLKRPSWWLATTAGFGIGLAQFIWLPLRASTLNDRLMLEHAPTSLRGTYMYTLGAFSQLKFAFSLAEIPDRIVLYLYLLGQQYGRLGLLLGIGGLAALLVRKPRHYHLLVGMYLVHVWFFVQYRVFDLDVFYLPAHFLWAIFMAFALMEILVWAERMLNPLPTGWARVGRWVLTAILILIALRIPVKNFSRNDHASDVAVNDFYANVWEFLPQDSALLTGGGVFGYDAFYWQLVYGTRADVLLPALTTPHPSPSDLQGRVVFSTTPISGETRNRGLAGLPKDLIAVDAWQVPVLSGAKSDTSGFGRRNRLLLYEIREKPPPLFVSEAHPDILVNEQMGPATLIGADVSPALIESGGRMHLVLYWRVSGPERVLLSTVLGDEELESHELGFGNLARYLTEVGPIEDRILVESYGIVVPSTLPAGAHPFSIRVSGQEREVFIDEIRIENQEEAMDRWLRIAG